MCKKRLHNNLALLLRS